jgi:glucose dehydrogenase
MARVLFAALACLTCCSTEWSEEAAEGLPAFSTRSASERLVDDDVLHDPPPGSWPSYGRDPRGTHFSPLSEIDTGNVQRMQLAWSLDLGDFPGRLEGTPLVWNGVIYATTPLGRVLAINAESGAINWSWESGIDLAPPLC